MNNQNTPLHRRHGILFVLSAPSGLGKTTLCNTLRQKEEFVYAISCTTRPPRAGEVNGKDYHFLSDADFLAKVAAGEFLEHAEVHGRHYGTLKSSVLENLKQGIDVLLDIDTQGGASIRSCLDPFIRSALADIFMMPPSLEELRHRLAGRGTESEEQMQIRLKNAANEMKCWRDYRYTLISGSREEDVENVRSILRAERAMSQRLILDA